MCSKFDQLKFLLQRKTDILDLIESKLDSSFQANQLLIERYSKPFRFDRKRNVGDIFLYIREDIPCKELKLYSHPHDIEGIFGEVSLRKAKWLLFPTYHPPSQVDQHLL